MREQHPHIGHRQGGQKTGEQQKSINKEVGRLLGQHQLVGDKQGGQQQIRHSEGDIDIDQESVEHSEPGVKSKYGLLFIGFLQQPSQLLHLYAKSINKISMDTLPLNTTISSLLPLSQKYTKHQILGKGKEIPPQSHSRQAPS